MLKRKVSGEIPRATAGGSLFGGGGRKTEDGQGQSETPFFYNRCARVTSEGCRGAVINGLPAAIALLNRAGLGTGCLKIKPV
jgi:hypothetical protein